MPASSDTGAGGVSHAMHYAKNIAGAAANGNAVLAWNLKDEIMEQMAGIRAGSGRFVVRIPAVEKYA